MTSDACCDNGCGLIIYVIPHNDGIDAVVRTMTEAKWPKNKIKFISEAMEVVLFNNIFEFDGDLYKQIKGTAMGTPIDPSYAILFMDQYERSILRSLSITPQIYCRYIDDIFVLHKRDNVNELEAAFKNSRPLEFEFHAGHEANFLDLRLYMS